jgi:hypothetical protein
MTELIEKIAAVNEMIIKAKKLIKFYHKEAQTYQTARMNDIARLRLSRYYIMCGVADRLTNYRNNLIKKLSAQIAESKLTYRFYVAGTMFAHATDNEADAKNYASKWQDDTVEVWDNGKLIDKQLARDIFNN